MYTSKLLRIGCLGSNHGLLVGDNRLAGNLGDCSIDSSRLGDLLLKGRRGGDLGSRLRLDGVLSGRRGELGLLDDRSSALGGLLNLLARTMVASKEVMDLAAVVASVLLANGRNLLHLLRGNISDLSGLRVDKLRGVVELLINKLLVGSVNQRNKENDSGANNSKAPVGNELDKVVGNEGSDKGLGMSVASIM